MHEFDVDECRRRCEMSLKNTAVGKWLAAALEEVERMSHRVDYLESRIERLTLRGGHLHINDDGNWMTCREWGERVMRGDSP